jgi:hypothetical protein
MYIYLRVDIPIHHNAERIVPKFVLVTWQGVDNGLFSDDESGEGWNSLSFSDGQQLAAGHAASDPIEFDRSACDDSAEARIRSHPILPTSRT